MKAPETGTHTEKLKDMSRSLVRKLELQPQCWTPEPWPFCGSAPCGFRGGGEGFRGLEVTLHSRSPEMALLIRCEQVGCEKTGRRLGGGFDPSSGGSPALPLARSLQVPIHPPRSHLLALPSKGAVVGPPSSQRTQASAVRHPLLKASSLSRSRRMKPGPYPW